MNSKNNPESNNEPSAELNTELSAEETQALDVLLAEIHAAPAPDLSKQILAQLGPLTAGTDVRRSNDRLAGDSGIRVAPRRRKPKRSLGTIAAVIATVAASIVVVVWMRGGEDEKVANNVDPGSITAPVQDVANAPRPLGDANELDQSQELETFPPEKLRPRKRVPVPMRSNVPLVADNDPGTPDLITPRSAPRQHNRSLQAIADVSQQVDQSVNGYWKAVGIEPTDEASSDEIVTRLANSLGVEIPANVISDPAALRSELVAGDMPKEIAKRWLNEITDGGVGSLEAQTRDSLVAEIAKGFQPKKSFGKTIAGLLGGKKDVSSAFYSAASLGGHDSMVRRLASVTMNVDLRCTKCHDAKIQSSGQQESYWSFSTFIRRGTKRSRSGNWSVVDADKMSRKSAFYELSDGRQRLVEPKIASEWMPSQADSTPSDSTPRDISQWSNQLAASPELARALVNSLWQMVHGRPLRGHVIDTITAPHDAMLDQLENQLADDLMQSNFDIARTLALVIGSPVTRRSVPEALLTKNALTASDADIRSAMNTVNAFAAAMPPKSDLSMGRRLDIVMKSVGGRIGDLNGADALLANIGSTKTGASGRNPTAKVEVTGYPFKASSLPVQWLSSIKSYEERVDHLGYLAGMNKVPAPVRQAAMKLGDNNRNQTLALARVWWLLQPR